MPTQAGQFLAVPRESGESSPGNSKTGFAGTVGEF